MRTEQSNQCVVCGGVKVDMRAGEFSIHFIGESGRESKQCETRGQVRFLYAHSGELQSLEKSFLEKSSGVGFNG